MSSQGHAGSRLPSAADWERWGVDPAWSTWLTVAGHRWHLLEAGPGSDLTGRGAPRIVCVHGNPTWGILWQPILRALGDRFHVVAPDQLGMGWSQRTDRPRRYRERVADLGAVIDALDARDGETPPIVLVAHDWGGAIAMGWAVDHPDRMAGLVLTNTGIAVPAGRRAPGLIRLAASRGMLATVCRRTSVFVRGTAWLSRGRTPAWFREALMAPYRRAVDRAAIEGFVADVPFDDTHPSAADVADVAQRLPELDVPVLLAWGGSDPVFDDDFADDLAARFRHVSIHRFPGANHLVPVDEDLAPVVEAFVERLPVEDDAAPAGAAEGADFRPVWAGLEDRADDDAVAFYVGASGRSVSFRELDTLVGRIGERLRAAGVQPGDRIALLVPPSVELVAVVYACWRVGAVTVIADRGLGLGGLGNAIRSARVSWVLGPRPARAAARTLRWAPRATALVLEDLVADPSDAPAGGTPDIDAGPTDDTAGSAPASASGHSAGSAGSAPDSASGHSAGSAGSSPELGAGPGPDDPIAVLFTSGATGPAKGVRYRHRQLAAQRDALAATYSIGPDDRFVAAFAPFALYGPALGIGSAVPDVDVTRPGALTAEALDQACAAIGATMVFASPAALANVVATADGAGGGTSPEAVAGSGGTTGSALARVRTVMSAGAPVPVATLRAVARLTPAATLHTPYGMTECLPVADIDLVGIEAALTGGDGEASAEVGRGVCVGPPVPGCEVRVAPIGFDAGLPLEPALDAGVTGELLVRAPWCSDGYDRRWHTERSARPVDAEGLVWHRTGDVGHVDERGRVWVEGRSAHVIHAAGAPITPVPVEVAAESRALVRRAAAVGVGPIGRQQLVVVVEPTDIGGAGAPAGRRRRRRDSGALALADAELASSVRTAVATATGHAVAAVCVTEALPVDIRHNAKIDRTAVAAAASTLLAGG